MKGQKRIRNYGITVGCMNTGPMNSITDVEGVKVGHTTLDDMEMKTGVTAILPHEGNVFVEKVMAACHVINGYGKSIGLIQIEEMGYIETPILLTTTFGVGTAFNALIEYTLKSNASVKSVNPVVCECNDAYLNDVKQVFVRKEHMLNAIRNAESEFEEGAVGAGTGMSCYGLKGGIGTASRIIKTDKTKYVLGVLVLSNFGEISDLTIDGIKAGKIITEAIGSEKIDDSYLSGSVIVIIATDAPVIGRQLKRAAKRASAGLARTGSNINNTSGEVVIAFTTSNRIRANEIYVTSSIEILNENMMDLVFRAVAESTEEAVLNSLVCAKGKTGYEGHTRESLKKYMHLIANDRKGEE